MERQEGRERKGRKENKKRERIGKKVEKKRYTRQKEEREGRGHASFF